MDGEDPTALIQGALRWVGRVDESRPKTPRFAWQGAGLVATFSGPRIALKLRSEGTDSLYYQSVIDGVPGARIEVAPGADRVVTVASGLGTGDHDLELYRETEPQFGTSTFVGIVSGTLKGAKPGSGRLIEVVGDSISAGYGALETETHDSPEDEGCFGDPGNSSWYATYAAIAGRALGAEVSTIAQSGWGMVRDGEGGREQTLPSVYDNLLGLDSSPVYDFARQPDAVVINLGTNDWSQGNPGKSFETAYQAFLAHVRNKYPDAWLFLTVGSVFEQERLDQVSARLKRVVAARAAAGDQRVSSFELGSQDPSTTGCEWHPSAAEHVRMSAILESELRDKLGW